MPAPFTIINMQQLIPVTEADLAGYEDNIRALLPNIMRTPINCDTIALAPVTLSGVQTVDGVQGAASSTIVLCVNQNDPRENGPYTMQSGAWTRLTSQAQLTGMPWKQGTPDAGFRSVYAIMRGSQAGFFYWLISPDPIQYGVSPIWIEVLGTSVFTWHMQMAEVEIARDLDRNEKPLRLVYLQDKSQLSGAKIYKVLEILFRQAAANSADGMPDRHERLSKVYAARYEREMSTTTLRTIDQGRVRGGGRSKRIVRG
jgi:hypothetical protein